MKKGKKTSEKKDEEILTKKEIEAEEEEELEDILERKELDNDLKKG